jgi:WD40 repeat protein
MGCDNERTVEKSPEKNKGYPICRLTMPLNGEICSLVALDSNKLILGGNKELLLFDYNTKNFTLISNEHKKRINCLLKTPEGTIISGGQLGEIKVWDLDNKKSTCTLERHTSMIWELAYLGNDKLISVSDDNSAKIWNLKDKSSELLYKSKKQVSSVVVLNNNKVVLASGKNVLLFNLETKDQESVLDIQAWSLLKLKNGDVAAGLCNGLLYILKITDEITIKLKFPRGHNKIINNIIELEKGKLVTCSDENDLIVWDISEPEGIYIIKAHNNLVTGLCLIEGNKFASVSKDNQLKLYE